MEKSEEYLSTNIKNKLKKFSGVGLDKDSVN